MWSKNSYAGFGEGWLFCFVTEAEVSADIDDAGEEGGGGCSWSCLRREVAVLGAEDRDAIARIGGWGSAFSERSSSGTEG